MKKIYIALVLSAVATFQIGCGSADVGTANPEKVNKEVATQKQQGMGGAKARNGGGLAEMDAEPAPPGVQTGLPAGGQK